MPFLEHQTCDVTRPWSLFFPAPRPALPTRSCLQAEASPQHLAPWLPDAPCAFRLHPFVNQSLHSLHQWGPSGRWIPLKTERQFPAHVLETRGRAVWKVYNGSSPKEQRATDICSVCACASTDHSQGSSSRATPATAASSWLPSHCGPIRTESSGDYIMFLSVINEKGKPRCDPALLKLKMKLIFKKKVSIFKKEHQNTNVSPCNGIRGEKGEWTAEEYGLFITSACSKLVCIPNVFIYSTQ